MPHRAHLPPIIISFKTHPRYHHAHLYLLTGRKLPFLPSLRHPLDLSPPTPLSEIYPSLTLDLLQVPPPLGLASAQIIRHFTPFPPSYDPATLNLPPSPSLHKPRPKQARHLHLSLPKIRNTKFTTTLNDASKKNLRKATQHMRLVLRRAKGSIWRDLGRRRLMRNLRGGLRRRRKLEEGDIFRGSGGHK